MVAWYWLILLAVFIAIEIVTLGLATIWFAAGALFAYIAAWLHAPFPVQIFCFFAVSFVLLFFTRPIALKYFNKDREKTNVESIVGMIGKVTGDIDNFEQKGNVFVDGKDWTARAEKEDMKIPQGTRVKIVAINGVKLIVTDNFEE